MAIGRKSIGRSRRFDNKKEPQTPLVVFVQADKCNRICDVHMGIFSEGHYIPQRRLPATFSRFQGQQYDDNEIIEYLYEAAEEELNSMGL